MDGAAHLPLLRTRMPALQVGGELASTNPILVAMLITVCILRYVSWLVLLTFLPSREGRASNRPS